MFVSVRRTDPHARKRRGGVEKPKSTPVPRYDQNNSNFFFWSSHKSNILQNKMAKSRSHNELVRVVVMGLRNRSTSSEYRVVVTTVPRKKKVEILFMGHGVCAWKSFLIPHGMIIRTIALGHIWLAHTNIAENGSPQFQFFLETDHSQKGEWKNNPSAALKSVCAKLGIVMDESVSGRLMLGIHSKPMQALICEYYWTALSSNNRLYDLYIRYSQLQQVTLSANLGIVQLHQEITKPLQVERQSKRLRRVSVSTDDEDNIGTLLDDPLLDIFSQDIESRNDIYDG